MVKIENSVEISTLSEEIESCIHYSLQNCEFRDVGNLLNGHISNWPMILDQIQKSET